MPLQRRKLDFTGFDQLLADVALLESRGYQRAGKWDLTQACEHLTNFMRGSLEGFTATAPWFLRILGRVIRWRILSSRGMPAGFKGPAQAMPTEHLGGQEDSVRMGAFRVYVERVRTHAGEFIPSPLLGKLTPEQWRQLHLIHSAHHLSFLVPNS